MNVMHVEQAAVVIADALRPERFVAGAAKELPPGELRCVHRPADLVPWEIFRGHLLDASQTRQRRCFDSWLVFQGAARDEPLLAVRLATEERRVYVVRSVQVHGHEAIEEDGILTTRPVVKWLRELVGTLDLNEYPEVAAFQHALEHLLHLAFVGTSRLPVTSLESPLPAFALGRLFYRPAHPGVEYDMRWLEFALRSGDQATADTFLNRPDFSDLIRLLFNHLALSPWTEFIPRLTRLVLRRPAAEAASLLGYFLRHLVRHLTAYDLKTFHNRGANYPDALALDLWLQGLIGLLERQAELRQERLLRRAFRQAWLIRKTVEGLPVPDHPTSPGDNLRVLPPPFERLPEEQVLWPEQRRRRLFTDQPAESWLPPAMADLLRDTLRDLDHIGELRELGLAVFLDRPFGVFKAPGEVDRTPLFAYEAFSRRIAQRRLDWWHDLGFLPKSCYEELQKRLGELPIRGIPVTQLPGRERPGVVALEDALRASPDFVILRAARSTQQLARRILGDSLFASTGLGSHRDILPIRSPRSRILADAEAFLTVYDEQSRPILEFGLGQTEPGPIRYRERLGVEELADGLRLLRLWNDAGEELRP
ncbi:MAG: hypothetical protein NZM31_07625 [Gemmatales bacterium]|nr:hypothetical protein [Gemmatales bacterium]MDW8386864.1 hypothetical protein [Gemmatales bacterium]